MSSPPGTAIERLAPAGSRTRSTRRSVLHAAHAVPSDSASVIDGKYGPAAAHVRSSVAPESRPGGTARS